MTNEELLRKLSDVLDETVRAVDADLAMADDIHPAVAKIGGYLAEKARLPAALARLEAQKASAASGIPARDEAVRLSRHSVRTLEDKVRKLGEKIDRNRAALTKDDAETVEPACVPQALKGLRLPTRTEIIEEARLEMIAAEDGLKAARATLKRAQAFRTGVDTRIANLDREIADVRKAVADHEGRLEETLKLLRKTIAHLRNRQEKRDRKRGARRTSPDVAGTPDGFVDLRLPPCGPSDEEVRRMCEEAGIPIDGPDDLAAARSLFCG